ncbi:hypothetical protein PQX77_019556 [Marasmius sp. AFHP31]|nr:hypothetical protein PQX77_019556 [Marasmius sp. AFHP31]
MSSESSERVRAESYTYDPGNWVAHPEFRIVSHVHKEVRGCPNPLGHAVIAKNANDPGLQNTLEIIEDNVARPFKESTQRAKAKATMLEAKLQAMSTDHEEKIKSLTSSYSKKLNTLQDKYNIILEEKSKLIIEFAPFQETTERNLRESTPPRLQLTPYQRPKDRAFNRRNNHAGGSNIPQHTSTVVTASLSPLYPDWGNLQIPFPNQATAWTTLEHSGYHPARDNTLVTINWLQYDGVGKTSAYVDQCLATNTIPTPTIFPSGVSISLQAIPTVRNELLALISWPSVQGTEYAPNINPFYGAEREILGKLPGVYPSWATLSKFLNHSTFRILGIPTKWSTPCVLPPITTPDAANRNDWKLWGYYYFVHGDVHSLLGQIMLDCGILDIKNIRAGRILIELTPPRTVKSREAFNAFRLGFISKAGLYEELLMKYNLAICPVIKLIRPIGGPPYDLEFMTRHFTSCGISIATYNSMNRFGWQFCIDQQHLTSNAASVKNQYLILLNEARLRALFYPITPPGPNAIQRIPEDWPVPYSIIEFQRRRAQLALLREAKAISSNYKLVRQTQFPEGFDDIGFGTLSVSTGDPEGATSSQLDELGTSQAPPQDTVIVNAISLGN